MPSPPLLAHSSNLLNYSGPSLQEGPSKENLQENDKFFVNEIKKETKEKLLMRICHRCQHVNESVAELERCTQCQKSFLPLRYFEKVHTAHGDEWKNNFSRVSDIEEEDLIKGLFVLW